MKKNLLIISLLIIISSLTWHAWAKQADLNLLDVSAEDLVFDTENNHAQFFGNVEAVYRDFRILSEQLVYDETEKIVEISGSVKIIGDQLQTSAQKAEIDLETELITLTGEVEVSMEENLIRGSLVTYDLKTGRLKAKQAQVIIQNTGQ